MWEIIISKVVQLRKWLSCLQWFCSFLSKMNLYFVNFCCRILRKKLHLDFKIVAHYFVNYQQTLLATRNFIYLSFCIYIDTYIKCQINMLHFILNTSFFFYSEHVCKKETSLQLQLKLASWMNVSCGMLTRKILSSVCIYLLDWLKLFHHHF